MKSLFLLLLFILAGCQIDANKKIDRTKFTFKTGSDTQLFFKNVRQSYYDVEENKAAKFNVFRFSKRSKDEGKPLVNFAIVSNYLNDEAYLLLEANELAGDLPLTITSTNDSTTTSRTIVLETQNRESTLSFAADLYDDLKRNNQFQLHLKDSLVSIFDTYEEREALRITVSDYYRLTRVY